MKKRFSLCILMYTIFILGGVQETPATDVDQDAASSDKAAIEEAIASYIEAFNARDAQKLAELWAPEGVYISRLSGDRVIGREALTQEFTALFEEEKDARLEVTTESIEFVSPNVALERGAATVLRAEGPPAESHYSAVYVKRDGKWLIDRISEEETPPDHSHYGQLKDLEWMIGEWADQAGENVIKTECQWTRNKNYMTRSFTVSIEGQVDMAGMQVLGWDPAEKKFRSWVFDSDGGFAEGVWKRNGERWIVQSTATLPDGRKGSSISIIRPIDENHFGWQKVSRVVEGEILPNIDEVIISRVGTQK